jgi:phenylacetate-CoA ligase
MISFDLSLQFNGYPIAEAKAELQKIAAFTAIEKENFIEKKEIVAFHLNNNLLSTAGWCKIG